MLMRVIESEKKVFTRRDVIRRLQRRILRKKISPGSYARDAVVV